ncbi:MAG TPA: DUF1080 domain-containing protein [Pirellulaceae bacterium]
MLRCGSSAISNIAWCLIVVPGVAHDARGQVTTTPENPGDVPDRQGAWSRLFDGKSLNGWELTPFGGEGPVRVQQGAISLGVGSPLTGITKRNGETFPTLDYEIKLEARRVSGSDFFCGLTFPYQEDHATLILGGWGGGLVGISCLNQRDASENETTKYMSFELGRWYRVRLRTRKNRIEAWMDGKRVVNCYVEDRPVSTRPEVRLSRPLGIATYDTVGEVRNLEWRRYR